MRHLTALGLVIVSAVVFGACTESKTAPPAPVSGPPGAPEAASRAAETPPPVEEAPAAPVVSPAPESDPALTAAIDDINARWAQVAALRAKVELSSNLMMGPVRNGRIEGQGVYEYQKSGEIGLYCAEIVLRFKTDGETAAEASTEAAPVPQMPAGASIKLLHVFDGKDVYLQNTVAVPIPGISEPPVTTIVIRGTPEEMGAFQLPGSFGPNPLEQYQKDGWALHLLPESTIDNRPVYVIEARAPEDASGLTAPGRQLAHFDRASGTLVKLVHYAEADEPAATTEFKGLEFNAVIDQTHFTYEAPPGVVVREAKEIAQMFQGLGAPIPGRAPPYPPSMAPPPSPPPPAADEPGA